MGKFAIRVRTTSGWEDKVVDADTYEQAVQAEVDAAEEGSSVEVCKGADMTWLDETQPPTGTTGATGATGPTGTSASHHRTKHDK